MKRRAFISANFNCNFFVLNKNDPIFNNEIMIDLLDRWYILAYV